MKKDKNLQQESFCYKQGGIVYKSFSHHMPYNAPT